MTEQTAATLVRLLTESNQTLATAESCTGGLIAKQITDVSGCSATFVGGCVTYTNEIKRSLLGVDQEILDTYTEVSEACAKAMAEGVCRRLNADVGISTTGYAGPGGGTAQNPVGTVYIAVATPRRTICRKIQAPSHFDRIQVRELAARTALQMATEVLSK